MAIDIHINDLLEWFNNTTRKKVEPLKKTAAKKINKFEDIIRDFKDVCHDLARIEPSSTDKEDISAKSAQRLSLKYIKELENIEIPSEPYDYESLEKLKNDLGKIINNFLHLGRKLIPKLTQLYKKEIHGINFYFQNLGNEWKKLIKFLDGKYKEVQEIDQIISKIQKIQNVFKQITDLRVKQKEIEQKIRELEDKKKDLENKYLEIEKNEDLKLISDLTNNYSRLKQKFLGQIGTLRKPLVKFEKIVGNKFEYQLSPEANKLLIKYIEDPFTTIINEQEGHPILNEILTKLKNALKNKALDLSSSKNQKALSKVDQILNQSLVKTQKKLFEIDKKIKNLKSNEEIKKLLEKKKKIQNEIDKIQVKINEERVNLDKVIDDFNRNKDKIIDYRSDLIKSIKKITNKDINIIFEYE
ncbi:MAG: hypothetical protein ACTSRP_25535 [Candidatus Helarchaeota archaeon]